MQKLKILAIKKKLKIYKAIFPMSLEFYCYFFNLWTFELFTY